MKPGRPAAGTVQGAERDAHRPHRPGRRARLGGDLGQRQARLGRRAGDLVDQDGPGQAAAARGRHRPASATSSATITVSTGMPSARASSAARPKFSRSPV